MIEANEAKTKRKTGWQLQLSLWRTCRTMGNDQYYSEIQNFMSLIIIEKRDNLQYNNTITITFHFLQTQHAVNSGNRQRARESYKKAICSLSVFFLCFPCFGFVLGAIIVALRVTLA